MIDLYSLADFFDKVKWVELAITHEINRVPWENIIGYSTARTYVRTVVLLRNETDTPIVPELENDFSLDDLITLVLPEESFLSVRPITKKAMMLKSTVYCHLTQTKRWKLRLRK
jgi:hypothetical protein